MKRILVIEDDPDIVLLLDHHLRKQGYVVDSATDGEAGLRAALAKRPDVVLLDLNLPGMDGLEVCKRIRREPSVGDVPVIMLTARVGETATIAGLDHGADDYVTKPFSAQVILARVRAILRRSDRGADDGVLSDGSLVVDLGARTLAVDGREIALTRKEFDLLVDLMRARGRVLTRESLLERVWGYTYPGETRTVDVHVRRLRQKLGAPAERRIETVVGVGYRWRGAPE